MDFSFNQVLMALATTSLLYLSGRASELVMEGRWFDSCWENSEFLFPSLPVSLTEKIHLSRYNLLLLCCCLFAEFRSIVCFSVCLFFIVTL